MKAKKKQDNQEKTNNIIQRKDGNSFVKPKASATNFTSPSSSKKKNSSLPKTVQSNMESSLGQDFSNVSIHTNSQKAVQMNARAYTQGEQVHFAPGEFNPNSDKGKNLIGHEFTHVAQQRAGVVKPTKVLHKGVSINNDKHLESEADTFGAKAARGEAVSKYRGAKASTSATMQGKVDNTSIADNNLSDQIRAGLSPVQNQNVVTQFTLSNDILNSIQITGPIYTQGIIDRIRAASVANRQAVLADNALITAIRNNLNLTAIEKSLIMSELMVGSQDWENPPNSDFFEFFIVNRATGLMPTVDSMNCWESIIYAAYLAGQVDANWIFTYYSNAGALPGTTTNPTPQLWAGLGYVSSLPIVNASGLVNVGDLVFYSSQGSSHPGHVAVYVGNDEVISLWNKPNGVRSVQRISINDLSGTQQYTSPPW